MLSTDSSRAELFGDAAVQGPRDEISALPLPHWTLATAVRRRRLQGGPNKLAIQVFGAKVWATNGSDSTARPGSSRAWLAEGRQSRERQRLISRLDAPGPGASSCSARIPPRRRRRRAQRRCSRMGAALAALRQKSDGDSPRSARPCL